MKREINLITPEYMEGSRVSWFRVIGMVLAVLLIFVFLSSFIVIEVYKASLQSDVEELEERRSALMEEVSEIREMEMVMESIKELDFLAAQVEEMKLPFSFNFTVMMETSEGGVDVLEVNVDEERHTVVRGRATTLENIAEYMLDLEELDFLTEVTHNYMELEEIDAFAFETRARMVDVD